MPYRSHAIVLAALSFGCKPASAPISDHHSDPGRIQASQEAVRDLPLEPAKQNVLAHLRARGGANLTYGLAVFYEAQSPEAAEELASWWRRSGAAVKVKLVPPTSEAERQALREEIAKSPPGSRVYVALQQETTWSVRAETAPKRLSDADVDAWFGLVSNAPRNSGWFRHGISLIEPDSVSPR